MILLDADVLMVDLRYRRDPRLPVTKVLLDAVTSGRVAGGITAHTLLEVVGILSFQTKPQKISRLHRTVTTRYNLKVVPELVWENGYAGCTYAEVQSALNLKMALGDAVQAAQIARFAPDAECLLTWNAKHFAGKLPVPVLTPNEWLRANPSDDDGGG